MRYELSDYEWTTIKPMLPNKPRGVRRVNDRRVLNGIFWILRSGAPWRDTNSRPTTWRSSNSHQSEFGCVLMSPRPRSLQELLDIPCSTKMRKVQLGINLSLHHEKCPRCGTWFVTLEWDERVNSREVQDLWHCCQCQNEFITVEFSDEKARPHSRRSLSHSSQAC
jgi:hypothetical protein